MTDDIQECPYCLSEIPGAASKCRHCAADIYDPADADTRGFWIVGIIMTLLGFAIVAGNDNGDGDWAFVLVGIGGVILQIAVIATAVSIGLRDADRRTFDLRKAIANRFAGDS